MDLKESAMRLLLAALTAVSALLVYRRSGAARVVFLLDAETRGPLTTWTCLQLLRFAVADSGKACLSDAGSGATKSSGRFKVHCFENAMAPDII